MKWEERGAALVCTGKEQRLIRMDWLRPGWYYFGREKSNQSNAVRALKPVCRRTPIRRDRKPAGLSGWPFSEPCKAGVVGRLLQCDP